MTQNFHAHHDRRLFRGDVDVEPIALPRFKRVIADMFGNFRHLPRVPRARHLACGSR
jgi:hypothetical protein